MVGEVHKALTIAGLDSGGGAGIIADLKTFSALGVWGMAAITSVTAQNTVGVFGVQDIATEMVRKQIEAVVEDIGVDAAKTGMLHTREIIMAVADEVENYGFPLVVDPVMVAKSGAPLMREDAREVLIRKLFPLASIVTPNIPEAEAITGIKIRSIEDMESAAKYIVERLGCGAAVVKGGHMEGEKSIDVLYHDGEFFHFESPRIQTKNTHGTGCTYSAAITACLARGEGIVDAVRTAKEFIHIAILYGYDIGNGYGPVNHMAWLYRKAEKYEVIRELQEALSEIESNPEYSRLIPEVGMNIALAIEHMMDREDIAAIPGRIRRTDRGPKACCGPEFGASKHLASYITVAREYDRNIRSAINIRFDWETIRKLQELGLVVSSYDRSMEPEEIKKKEGMTIPWGTREAIKKIGRVPNVIYHEGDIGKEPMIVLLGKNTKELIEILKKIV